ncbi:hypothetical protein PPERSA_03489 [Pseudocohnilembus persalinus]|uniref:Transmembrane protein n=1 Tax=Pseudocohnilembus persalinus TaxID=266149 RepID=A0A0V0QBV3_PSEPJ|nr:hypothetical protein PPERSA_03489 [Pseudocohnilembus persalinus]|eukprot:KRW99688.1 hypothetical protein PPERSA_03489 [Pseudocohnilembus persalinus]
MIYFLLIINLILLLKKNIKKKYIKMQIKKNTKSILNTVASSIFYMSLAFYSNTLYHEAKHQDQVSFHFYWNLALWIFSWVIQFIGHGVFEKRKPALMDNLLQTLVAPDFIVIQWCFYLGYRHEEYVQIKKKIHNNINIWKEKQKNQKDSQNNIKQLGLICKKNHKI